MRTITNEGVVEQEPGIVVHLPRRGGHLVQVRRGGHIPAAPYIGKKWVTSVEEQFDRPIAQTSGAGVELHESSCG